MSCHNPYDADSEFRMVCSCGGYQTSVAYSPYYKGLMFGCERATGCRSDDEGMYPTEAEAAEALDFYADRYDLMISPAGALDPTEDWV